MYSTANDMKRWLEYLLDLPGVPMHQDPAATATYIPASQLRWTQGLSHAGIPVGIGLGWVHLTQPDDPATIIQKTGGGAGYTTYIALNPKHHIGLFFAATEGRRGHSDIFRGSNDILTYLAGVMPMPGPEELAARGAKAGVHVRRATMHKHRRSSPRVARQAARNSGVATGQ
jgi:D-alanyl-D-alanine-carboxypeptidase/D-alanyl-D-alanine-endopeptidase